MKYSNSATKIASMIVIAILCALATPAFAAPNALNSGGIDGAVTQTRVGDIFRRFGEREHPIPADMIDLVERYIALNTGSKRKTIAAYMKRKPQYLPMIQRIFDESGIPREFAYIAMFESGLDPNAGTRSGVRGLWQFTPNTARAFKLKVNERVDQRIDPEKSTRAVAAYFKYLIDMFGGGKNSAALAMIAYNVGEGKLMRALRKTDDPAARFDFWHQYEAGHLPAETRTFVAQILAMIIVAENTREFGFE